MVAANRTWGCFFNVLLNVLLSVQAIVCVQGVGAVASTHVLPDAARAGALAMTIESDGRLSPICASIN